MSWAASGAGQAPFAAPNALIELGAIRALVRRQGMCGGHMMSAMPLGLLQGWVRTRPVVPLPAQPVQHLVVEWAVRGQDGAGVDRPFAA